MFAQNLKSLRKEKGYTQESLASKLNVVRQTISKWEKGLSVPDAELLQRLADILGVNVGILLGGYASDTTDTTGNHSGIESLLNHINEQLAVKIRLEKKILTILVSIFSFALIVSIVLICVHYIGQNANNTMLDGTIAGRIVLQASVGKYPVKNYDYEIEYNNKYQIVTFTGNTDAELDNIIPAPGRNGGVRIYDVREFLKSLTDYCEDRGGTVSISEASGLELP